MEISLREFGPQDYEALSEIDYAIYPEYRYSAEEWRYDDEHFDRKKYILKRYVAEAEGEVVGYAQYRHSPHMFHPKRSGLESTSIRGGSGGDRLTAL